MKLYTFNFTSTNNSKQTKKTNNFSKYAKQTDYSKILDSIILNNVINTNTYLTKTATDKAVEEAFKANTSIKYSLSTYAAYLVNLIKSKTNFPFKFGKKYITNNGTIIIFYDDEVQIGTDIYSYEEFEDELFLNNLEQPKKKIIIDIFAPGKNISINIKK